MVNNVSLTKIYSSGKNGHMGRGSRPVMVTIKTGDVEKTKALTDVEQCGFTWGYNGRRDINLAHSIMVDYFEDPNVPRGLWITFYEEVLQTFKPEDEWDITGQMISEWIYNRFPMPDEEPESVEDVTDARDRRKPLEEKPEGIPAVSAGTIGMTATPTLIEREEPEGEVLDEEDDLDDDLDDFEDDEEDDEGY